MKARVARRLFAAMSMAWLSGAAALADPAADRAAIQARLAEVPPSYMAGDAFMGVALLAEGDHILLSRGYGQANLDWRIDNAPDVKFRVGSLTKQFTAALVLLLQQDGRLNISDPVVKYLPTAPAAWKAITLAQLLGHVSGIANFTSDPTFPTWSASPHTAADELAFIEAKPLDFEPGSKFAYSNSNYEVLGAVIEKVTGKTYAAVLRERIFGPLGMVDTGLDSDGLILAKRAQGYQPASDGGGLEQARSESLSVPWAAGSLYSTTADLLRWERGLFGGKVLTPASLAAMTTPGKGDYGMGLIIQTINGVKVIWHNGGIEGFNSYLAYVPDRQITAIVFSNVSGPTPDVIGAQMLDVALGRTVVLPTERKAVPISAKQLEDYTGAYRSSELSDFEIHISQGQLMIKRNGVDRSLFYEGMKGDHALFYAPTRFYEIEFTPGENHVAKSVVFHFGARM